MLFQHHAALCISIHALREEGDAQLRNPKARRRDISIHALREEGDYYDHHIWSKATVFLSTPSARRATQAVSPQVSQ